MLRNLTSVIAVLAITILIVIQVYVIINYYHLKSRDFDMVYTKMTTGIIEQSDFTIYDQVDDALNGLSIIYFLKGLRDSAGFMSSKASNKILVQFDSVLYQYDMNIKNIRRYLTDNKLDTTFTSFYDIRDITLFMPGDTVHIYSKTHNLEDKIEKKGLYIKSYDKEGNYYAVQYDYFIDFTRKHRIILSEIWGLLLLTIVTIIVVMSAFTYTLATLKRQKKLTELKSDFIDNISHEFKTPISVISVAASSLKNGKVLENKNRILEISTMLEKQNTFLARMIDNVIDVSALDRSELVLARKSTLVIQFLHQTILSFTKDVAGVPVEIHEEYLIPDDFVYSLDTEQFTRVIYNILSNSVKYCEHSPVIHIKASIEDQFSIEISDNGIGIKKEHIDQIFNKFYRADNPNNAKGLGLGLYIIKRIVENHNGTISIESSSGTGTTVTILLPI